MGSLYESGIQENALVQFLRVADEQSLVLESCLLPKENADECRSVLLAAYEDRFKAMKARIEESLAK